jgi:hypothetical protein
MATYFHCPSRVNRSLISHALAALPEACVNPWFPLGAPFDYLVVNNDQIGAAPDFAALETSLAAARAESLAQAGADGGPRRRHREAELGA